MPYDVAVLRSVVRAMFQNIGPDIVSDETLDFLLFKGLRRLSNDSPHERTTQLPQSSNQLYVLSTLISDWEPGFSTLRALSLVPQSSAGTDFTWLRPGRDYRIVEVGNEYRLLVATRVPTDGLLAKYVVPWRVEGLDGSLLTTVTKRFQNSLELACAIELARARAANSAGTLDRSIQADIINWRSKQREYSAQADVWERQYWLSLGYSEKGAPPPVALAIDYDFVHEDKGVSLTHE